MQTDADIPFPSRRSYTMNRPWATLEVGESFLFSFDMYQCSNAHSNARYHSKDGKQFKARKTGQGMRVWRLK